MNADEVMEMLDDKIDAYYMAYILSAIFLIKILWFFANQMTYRALRKYSHEFAKDPRAHPRTKWRS